MTTNPANKTQTVAYDNVGNTLSQTDEANQTTTFAYDAANRMLTKTDALDGVTAYGYDTVGNLLTVTEPGNLVTTYVYDAANRLTSKTVPNGTTQYAYDNANNLTTLTTNSGARREYVYADDNLVASEARYDAQNNWLVTYAFAYDPTHNLTSETETRPNQAALTTTRTYDDLNRLISVTDPYGGTTSYTFDAAGNLIGQTDPSGFSTSITPNASNLPATIVHRDENQNIVATTTNTYTNANELESWTTTDPVYNLTLNNDLHYNGNGYVDQANVSHTGANNSPSLTSSLQYKDNNLLGAWTQQGWNENHFLYDSANRLKCSEYNGSASTYLTYGDSGRRDKRYWRLGYNTCTTIDALPLPNQNIFDSSRETYTYDGWRLTGSIVRNCRWGNCDTDPASYTRWTNEYAYDGDGNVQTITQTEGTTTRVLTYTWEAGTHHLQSFTRAVNGSVNYSATFEYDRRDRIRKFCWNGANCHLFSYIGDTDWISTVKDQYGTLLQRYLYANGRPLRVDLRYISTLYPWYYRYNARGDATGFVQHNGDGGSGWRVFGAWGDLNYTSEYKGYYNWNAAWGYMAFPKEFNFDAHDALDIGLYYAHGRWYNQDTGLWLSPNEKGDYLYQPRPDPVNNAQVQTCQNDLPPTTPPIGGQNVDWLQGIDFPPGESQVLFEIRNDLLASARRHNTAKTNMDDNAFAALMASILHWEGKLPGNGKPDSDQWGDRFKSLADRILGTNFSTGVAKIKPSVAIEILKGEIPGLQGNYCYHIEGGLTYDQLQSLSSWSSPLRAAPDMNVFIAADLNNVKTSLEYLAANFERGSDRINAFGFQASVFNLATWHNGGAQTPGELEQAKRSTIDYGNLTLRAMPTSFKILQWQGVFLPYNDEEKRFVDENNLKP